MRLQKPLTSLFQESTKQWIEHGLILPGDEIKLVSAEDGCDQPGCCPPIIRFTATGWVELGILSGEVWGVTAAEILEWG